jgi:hypothetical protein
MKKILFSFSLILVVISQVNAQEIIKMAKNQVFLVKGSRAMPQIKYKAGITITLENKEDGMNFTVTKNGKNYPLFDPVSIATYGQLAEVDLESDGKTEIVAGYRNSPNDFIVNVYHKPEYELDYKLLCTFTGQGTCEFLPNREVKITAKDGTSKVLVIDSEGIVKEKI